MGKLFGIFLFCISIVGFFVINLSSWMFKLSGKRGINSNSSISIPGDEVEFVQHPVQVAFHPRNSTLVFLHIPKSGGVSFGERLTNLDVEPSCKPDPANFIPREAGPWVNDHPLLHPNSMKCFRSNDEKSNQACPALSQWLVSPLTVGWLGGVHPLLSYLEADIRQRLRSAEPCADLAFGVHFIAIVRDPISRFFAEFYENYDGWEYTHNGRRFPKPCSAQLPDPLHFYQAAGALAETFPSWLRCESNMAADRQTRILSAEPSSPELVPMYCSGGISREECKLNIAKHTLRELSFFGLADARCETELLFYAKFGLKFKGENREKTRHRSGRLRFADLKTEEQKLVLQRNSNDIRLYDYAKKLFYRRLEAYGVDSRLCDRSRH
eukprot:TRINITY_DN31534_c0_g1_i1.p1 TRINITY_DN31534_c0_g1~~TRINITY_DN31534_c0_g1_i1.p1  ORF type:complete len:382 (-),score=28.99 TRINITY_DN31534_c0_g1_i1:324-1469(-)